MKKRENEIDTRASSPSTTDKRWLFAKEKRDEDIPEINNPKIRFPFYKRRLMFKRELGIQEPVILCEPQILTVNRWLAGIISFYFISDECNSPRKWNEGWVLRNEHILERLLVVL